MVKLRAWWAHRQGLDGSLATATPAGVLDQAGWARSVGGANPYLTLHSRAGIDRKVADAAVADLAIHELTAARGCTYVVPADDFALALTVAGAMPPSELPTLAKLGVPRDELDRLCEAVLAALTGADRPLDPRAITAAVGDAVRNLGEEGHKRGASTTLPAALGLLQNAGEIRRVPVDGRLDQQRYGYVRWSPSPLSGGGLTVQEARQRLVRRYLAWTGGASLAHLRWFTGYGARDSRALLDAIDTVPVPGSDTLVMLAEDASAYHDFTPPPRPRYALVASIDSIFLLRRDLASLVDPADTGRRLIDSPAGATLGSGLADLPHHGILDRGRLIGLWDFDSTAGELVWASFQPADDELRAEVARTETYVRDQLGDARSFSLDSPARRSPRLDALRAMT